MKKTNVLFVSCFVVSQLVFFHFASASDKLNGETYPYLDPVPPISSNQNEHFVGCPLTNAPSPKFIWRGEEVTYSNNRDVAYDKEGWPQRVSNRWNTGLEGLVPSKAKTNVAAIDIRQYNNDRLYFYIGNNKEFYKPFEPLSSSKFIATLNLARRIREESTKKYGAARSFGLNSYTDLNTTWGQNRHVGEIITWQHSYEKDTDNAAISNQISQWFAGLGMRSRLNALVGSWLLRPADEFLYGGYGQGTNTRNAEFRTDDGRSVTLNPIYDTSLGTKSLSSVSLAETMRRIFEIEALQKDKLAQVAFPGVEKEDVETLLYGAPSEVQGGMQKGIGIYLTEALGGKENLDAQTNGEWRIFTKIGLGSEVDFVVTAAVCLPHYEGGRAFVLSVHTKGTNYLKEDAYMYEVVKGVTQALVPGFKK